MTTLRKEFPKEFFTCKVSELHSLLKGPSLFFLKGQEEPPLFISTLLHGNEHTGILALQKWLKPFMDGHRLLPRSLWIFIGNTEAAAQNLRHLTTQPDYNRLWKNFKGPEIKIASEIETLCWKKDIWAAVDIHNNTGRNPHYACVAHWEHAHLELASLFGRTVVHAEQPVETLTYSVAKYCPAVTLECGISGVETGTDHVIQFLETLVHYARLSAHKLNARDIDGYQTEAALKIDPKATLVFSQNKNADADLIFRPDLDLFNFSELKPGALFGYYKGDRPKLSAVDQNGTVKDLLHFVKGEIRTAQMVTPAMLTLSERAIREDCLGYLMVRKPLPE